MAGVTRLRPEVIADILRRFKAYRQSDLGIMQSCERIALHYGLRTESVHSVIKRYTPTGDAARDFISANALKLAMRVVRKANADQAIDILSRSNIGVLAPAKDEGGAGQSGFFLSVSAESCGAVRVQAGVVQSRSGPPTLEHSDERAYFDGESVVTTVEPAPLQLESEPEPPPIIDVTPRRRVGNTIARQAAIVAYKERLQAAREKKIRRGATEMRKKILKELAEAPAKSVVTTVD